MEEGGEGRGWRGKKVARGAERGGHRCGEGKEGAEGGAGGEGDGGKGGAG